jgi:hypothetical protein
MRFRVVATDGRAIFVELIFFKGGEAQLSERQHWVCATTIIISGGRRQNESKTIARSRNRKKGERGRKDKGRHHYS